MSDPTKRPGLNKNKVSKLIVKSLKSKSDSEIFSAFSVTPTLDKGRLKYEGYTAEAYANSVISQYNLDQLVSIANSLGVRVK